MPTYDRTDSFQRDYQALSVGERVAVRKAVRAFADDLKKGRFRRSLRVKRVQGTKGIFEMTWADDGRCTFEYGPEVKPGEPHVVWRRCGTHQIFKRP